MLAHDGIMVDEPCTIKRFLEKWQIQRLETCVFWWMATLLYGLQKTLVMFTGTIWRISRMKKEEYQRSNKTKDKKKGTKED